MTADQSRLLKAGLETMQHLDQMSYHADEIVFLFKDKDEELLRLIRSLDQEISVIERKIVCRLDNMIWGGTA